MAIYIDIDGQNKGKNKDGNDQFIFDVTDQGIYPEGIDEDKLKEYCFGKGYCTRWVVENGNMDYLKAGSDGKCPNGVQLSWTKTSCK